MSPTIICTGSCGHVCQCRVNWTRRLHRSQPVLTTVLQPAERGTSAGAAAPELQCCNRNEELVTIFGEIHRNGRDCLRCGRSGEGGSSEAALFCRREAGFTLGASCVVALTLDSHKMRLTPRPVKVKVLGCGRCLLLWPIVRTRCTTE